MDAKKPLATKPATTVDWKAALWEAAKRKRLVIFCGSGISVDTPSNLPQWDDLIASIANAAKDVDIALMGSAKANLKLYREVKSLASKNPTQVAYAIRTRMIELQSQYPSYQVSQRFVDRFRSVFSRAEPNEYHRTIVSTAYQHIVTTNYDTLLETAADSAKHRQFALRAFGFKEQRNIAYAMYNRLSCIIHAHGTLNDLGETLENLVFTSEDYSRVSRRYPGFRLTLESLFLQNTILFVGYGASDPHIEGVLEELAFAMEFAKSGDSEQHFLVMKRKKTTEILRQTKRSMRVKLIELDEYGDVLSLLKELQQAFPRTRENGPVANILPPTHS